jgi:cysteine synthase A
MGAGSSGGKEEDLDPALSELLDSFKSSYASWKLRNPEKDDDVVLNKIRKHLLPTPAMGLPRICPNIIDAIGQTPLVRLCKVTEGIAPGAEVLLKLESTNPGFSVKDRIAKSMIEDAESRGIISPDRTTIVDVTSGNTGIGYAMVGAAKGYKVIQVIPEPCSIERRALLLALGCEVVVTAKEVSIKGAVLKTKEILDSLGDKGWFPLQFSNPANPRAHHEHTGPEIFEQCDGKVDAFVAGCGTGGTLTGTSRYLLEKNPDVKVIAVDPDESSVLTGESPGPHAIQGIGPPFIPGVVDMETWDEVVRCPEAAALTMARRLAKEEGILTGISAGANVWAAIQVAKRPESAGKRIITVCPSAAERYLSTPLYCDIMEQARSMEMAQVDMSKEVGDFMTLQTLEDLKKGGLKLKPDFVVTSAPAPAAAD